VRKQEIRLRKQVRNQEIRRESRCGVGGGTTRNLDAVRRACRVIELGHAGTQCVGCRPGCEVVT